MTRQRTSRGRCPRCCPDGGAVFGFEYGATRAGDAWVCRNCGYQRPARKRKPVTGPNRRQAALADRIRGMGWAVEVKMIGRNAWLSCARELKPGLGLFFGDRAYGTVGPRGKIALTFMRFGGDKRLTDAIAVNVYMARVPSAEPAKETA